MFSIQAYQPSEAADAYVASVIRRHLKALGEPTSATVRRLPRPVDSPAA